jgi:hypothetical protein
MNKAISDNMKRLWASPEYRKKMIEAGGKTHYWKGKTLSTEHREKLHKSHLGQKPTPILIAVLKAQTQEENPNWKGDDAGYSAIHRWVYKQLGQPMDCQYCGKTGKSKHGIHWANISRQYKRKVEDWVRLCSSCHRLYDLNKIILTT